MAWYVRGALGGGFGGCEHSEWIESTAINEEQAMQDAEEIAREEYESYGGTQGLFNYDDYMDENPDATDEDAEQERNGDIDSWIEFEAREFETNPNEEE